MEVQTENVAEMIMGYVSLYGLKILAALAILIIGRIVVKAGANFVKKMMTRANVDKTLVSFLGNILYGLGLAFVIIATLSQIGVETASLAAVIAAAGLAIGLALQGSLSNLAAGVVIILFRFFRVGDYIEAAGTSGTVEDMNIFTTTLKTPDSKSVIVPNADITSGNIINYSAYPTRRCDLVFGIGYDDDMKKAKEIIEKTLKADERVLEDPEPTIFVSELGDSSVNITARPWVDRADLWPFKFDILEAVKAAFDKEGISIPFPQRDVHLFVEDNKVIEKLSPKKTAAAKTKSTSKTAKSTKTAAKKKSG